jgi:cytochrome P450
MVMNFDLFGGDPLFDEDLHTGIGRLAAEKRDLIYSPLNGGHWMVLGREAAFSALTDVTLFSNSPLHRWPEAVETIQIPIGLDPPEHGAYRKVLTEAFSPRSVIAMDGQIRALTNRLIDAVIDTGGCDFAKAVAEPLPVMTFMQLMGFPLSRLGEFRTWVLAGISEPDPVKRQVTWDKVLAMTGELIRAREVERQDDLISRLLDTEINGRPPSFDEMQRFCLMLFIAGLDTVTNAMSLIIRHLAKDPELQARLRADPRAIPSAIEEITRRYSANAVPRFVARDGEFCGAPLRKGDQVLVLLSAANLDPRGFAQPETIDLTRKTPHLAFGAGVHRCVGAQLARVELRAVLEEWLRRVPPFRLDPDRPWAYHTGYVFSIDSLPLVWDSAG